jgi:hypothetical protein
MKKRGPSTDQDYIGARDVWQFGPAGAPALKKRV